MVYWAVTAAVLSGGTENVRGSFPLSVFFSWRSLLSLTFSLIRLELPLLFVVVWLCAQLEPRAPAELQLHGWGVDLEGSLTSITPPQPDHMRVKGWWSRLYFYTAKPAFNETFSFYLYCIWSLRCSCACRRPQKLLYSGLKCIFSVLCSFSVLHLGAQVDLSNGQVEQWTVTDLSPLSDASGLILTSLGTGSTASLQTVTHHQQIL